MITYKVVSETTLEDTLLFSCQRPDQSAARPKDATAIELIIETSRNEDRALRAALHPRPPNRFAGGADRD